jgi:hypothetical protein
MECLALENARILREKAEKDSDQKALERMPSVATLLERIMEIPQNLDRLQVDRILIFELVLLVPRDEREIVDVLVKLRERELNRPYSELIEDRKIQLLFRLQIM